MFRTRYLLFLSVLLLGALAFALSSCGSGGGNGGGGGPNQQPQQPGPPFISAELNSFPAGAVPPGFTNNASVAVQDDSTGNSITSATVAINGTTLVYNTVNQDYEGSVVVAPGDAVSLSVTVAGKTYTASATQFTSYPSVVAPATGDTWDSDVENTVTWSGGAPTANANYVLGILDAADPNGLLQWPSSNSLLEVPAATTSYAIGAASIPAGNRVMLVGISSPGAAIPDAAPGSTLLVAGFNYAPITVTGFPVTVHASGTMSALRAVTWSGTQFVAVGSEVTGIFGKSVGSIFTSPDGITWTARYSDASLSGVASSGTGLVAVGGDSGGGVILTSPDGISWTRRVSGLAQNLEGVAWSGTQFVVVGTSGVLTSPDGVTWTPRSAVNASLTAVAWSGTQFAAVGVHGLILTSPDGMTWTDHSSGFSDLRGVVWSGTQFVAVGSFAIITSPDGVAWTFRSAVGGLILNAVASSSTQVVAVGQGLIYASSDGVAWSPRASGTLNDLNGIAWSGTKFVVVGIPTSGIGTTLTSP